VVAAWQRFESAKKLLIKNCSSDIKKPPRIWKKPYIMGISGGFEQEKPAKALLELRIFIATKDIGVNP